MNIEKLRENRKGATVIFTSFTRMKNKYSDSIFCCFEGDDSKYYFKRIEDKTKYSPENIVVLNCEGKKEVLRLSKLIKSKEEYSSVKVLYFIDKDFDPSVALIENTIYETPGYSIENFYTTQDAFIRILKVEFNYTEADSEYDLLLRLFKERQQEFHEKTRMLNAWIACQREKSDLDNTVRLNLSNFKLKDIVTVINLSTIETNYDKNVLENLFPEAFKLDDTSLQSKVEELNKCNPQQVFRGKFEIDFLYQFLESIKKEYNNPKGSLTKKPGVQLNQSKKNMVAEFSQYASTSDCLYKYLNNYILN